MVPGHTEKRKNSSNPNIESQISELTKAVMMLTKEKAVVSPLKSCGLCNDPGHFNDQCPLIQDQNEDVSAMGSWGDDRPRNNQGWNNNNSNRNNQNNHPNNHGYNQRPPQNYQQIPPFPAQNF